VPASAIALGHALPHIAHPVAVGSVVTMACGTLAREGVNYYKAKASSPYSYILSMKRELRRKFFGKLTDGLYFV
jgi:hypothetical protein